MLKVYFEEKNQRQLLAAFEEATQFGNELTDNQKTKCVNVIADYAVETFGIDLSLSQMKQVAFAAVALIEGLRSKTDNQIVS